MFYIVLIGAILSLGQLAFTAYLVNHEQVKQEEKVMYVVGSIALNFSSFLSVLFYMS